MSIVKFVPLMAQVTEKHIVHGYVQKFALATYKHYLVRKYKFLLQRFPCIDMCFCHLCHKWHEFNNGHNSAEKSVNA